MTENDYTQPGLNQRPPLLRQWTEGDLRQFLAERASELAIVQAEVVRLREALQYYMDPPTDERPQDYNAMGFGDRAFEALSQPSNMPDSLRRIGDLHRQPADLQAVGGIEIEQGQRVEVGKLRYELAIAQAQIATLKEIAHCLNLHCEECAVDNYGEDRECNCGHTEVAQRINDSLPMPESLRRIVVVVSSLDEWKQKVDAVFISGLPEGTVHKRIYDALNALTPEDLALITTLKEAK